MKKKRVVVTGILLAAAGAAGVAGLSTLRDMQVSANGGAEETYKTVTAAYGSVSVDIKEDGTVTYGTAEQVFELDDDATSTANASSSDAAATTPNGAATSAGNQTPGAEVEKSTEVNKTGSADMDMSMVGGMPSNMGGGSMNMEAGGGSAAGGATAGAAAGGTATVGNTSGSSSSSSSTVDTTVSTSLIVEKVNASAGQVVEKGDVLMTLTQDSIDDYRSELESIISSAELAVKQAEINKESKQAEADYTYNMYIAEGESAAETYQATLQDLADTVSEIEEQIEDSKELIEEYQGYVDDGDDDYEDDLEDEQENLENLQTKLTIAKNSEKTGAIEAKETYEKALTNYKYADQLYEIDTNGLGDDLEDAQETLASVQDTLADFNTLIDDGSIKAAYAGTLNSVSYAAGDAIEIGSTVAVYSDTDNVTMTVSVTQDDIANISVGQAVDITLDAYKNGVYEGEVTSIETSTSMGSSTVNYSVTARFTGDVKKVYSGMTGQCSFKVQSADDTVYINNNAVYQEGAKSYVDLINEDGSLTQTEVTTGFSNGRNVEIISGLESGDKVAVKGRSDT